MCSKSYQVPMGLRTGCEDQTRTAAQAGLTFAALLGNVFGTIEGLSGKSQVHLFTLCTFYRPQPVIIYIYMFRSAAHISMALVDRTIIKN